MTNMLVRAEGVSRRYKKNNWEEVALASATCIVKPGDRIAIMGPSGSGKSTLLHLMGGLEAPSEGRISWPGLGERASLRPGQVGLIFQMPSLLAPLTVVENVEIPLLLQKVSDEEAKQSALEILKRLNLYTLAEKLPEELSGGQAQRVAVARSLVGRPTLILADEPTGQLDHPTAEYLMDVLLDVLDGTDAALVIATHDSAIAKRLLQIWHIHNGVLEVGQ